MTAQLSVSTPQTSLPSTIVVSLDCHIFSGHKSSTTAQNKGFSFVHMHYALMIVYHRSLKSYFIFEPPRGKTNNVVSEQVEHKPACTSTEKS